MKHKIVNLCIKYNMDLSDIDFLNNYITHIKRQAKQEKAKEIFDDLEKMKDKIIKIYSLDYIELKKKHMNEGNDEK